MTIHNIEYSDNYREKKATVTLNVSELQTIANLLCQATKSDTAHTTMHYLHRDFYLVFSLVSHGCIDSVTVEYLDKLQERIKNSEDKEWI